MQPAPLQRGGHMVGPYSCGGDTCHRGVCVYDTCLVRVSVAMPRVACVMCGEDTCHCVVCCVHATHGLQAPGLNPWTAMKWHEVMISWLLQIFLSQMQLVPLNPKP